MGQTCKQQTTVASVADISVKNSTYTQVRRGVAGTILFHKILGYAAKQGKTLTEIKQLADTLVPSIHTIGVALHAATVPAVGQPGFELPDDEIEFGVGIHGRSRLPGSASTARACCSAL